jgi:hypothetical protein
LDTAEVHIVTPTEAHAMRQKHYRVRTEALKEQARELGVSPRKNAGLKELEQLLRVTPPRDNRETTVTPGHHLRERAPETASNTNTNTTANTARAISAVSVTPVPITPTPAGLAALAMKHAGLSQVSPSHPGLLQLLEAGTTSEELADAAREAADKGKGFAYALAIVRGRREDAANAAAIPARQDMLAALAGPALLAKLRGGSPL